jgi:hypothetical protein
LMAESEGFEPPIDLRLCLISSQVHSTGLCQLSALFYFISDHRLAAPLMTRNIVTWQPLPKIYPDNRRRNLARNG